MSRLRSLKVKIVNNRKIRNTRNTFIPTSVKGIRAENTFWEKLDKVAKKEGKTRNELIVVAVSKYCEGRRNG